MAPPWDTYQKIFQNILEGWPVFCKLHFHADTADAEAVRILGNLQKPCDAHFAGKGIIKGHTAHIGTQCFKVNRGRFRNGAGPRPAF